MKNKKILVVLNGGLPIPSIKGGAIETLIDLFIQDNEREKKYDIVVYSNYAKGVENESIKYKNTTFNYINTNTLKYKFSYGMRGILRRIFHVNIESSYTNILLNNIKDKINEYDLILVENYISCIEPISKIYNGKIVAHLHNDSIINAKYHNGVNIINDCDKIFTVSEYIKKTADSLVKQNKTVVVYNGIDQSVFKPDNKDREAMRKKYNISKNDIVFLFAGRVCEEKGIIPLAQAFANIAKENDHCKLMITGASFYSGSMNTKCIKEIKKILNDVKDKVIFTGYVPYKDMPHIYRLADVLMCPSLFEEALSLTLIEGMSTKLPVVITKSGGMPEVVTSKYKYKVNRENAIEELTKYMREFANSKEKREEASSFLYERSKVFSKEAFVDNFWKEIDELLGRK